MAQQALAEPTRRARLVYAACVAVALASMGCADDGYRVRVRLLDGLGARVARIELRLTNRPCAEQSPARMVGVLHTIDGERGTGLPALGDAPAGPVALVASAYDQTCVVVGYGCTDALLERGGSGVITVEVSETSGPACDGACADGTCLSFDAAPRDASTDARHDATTDDASMDARVDDGAMDAAPVPEDGFDAGTPPRDAGPDVRDAGPPPIDLGPDVRDMSAPADADGDAREAAVDAALPCPTGQCFGGVSCEALGAQCIGAVGECTSPDRSDVVCARCGDGRLCERSGDNGECHAGACCTFCWDTATQTCADRGGSLCGRTGSDCVRCTGSDVCVLGMCR